MSWQIPLTDLTVTDGDVDAVVQCLEEGWLTMGPRSRKVEEAVAEYSGAARGAAGSRGSAALRLACRALALGPGDEVIVPALTLVTSLAAPRYVGATPVLCDLASPTDLNLSVESVASHITDRTRAIVAVHFCGYPADVVGLRRLCDERGILLIEDAAQGIGAEVDGDGRRAGSVGHAG